MKIPFIKLRPDAQPPVYATQGAAGADLHACLDKPLEFLPGQTHLVSLGIAAQIPPGYVGVVCARSGMASKRGLAPANKVGIVDSDYRGEWFVPVHNHSAEPQVIQPGERFAQLLIVPVVTGDFIQVEALDPTDRGSGGFGSTGR